MPDFIESMRQERFIRAVWEACDPGERRLVGEVRRNYKGPPIKAALWGGQLRAVREALQDLVVSGRVSVTHDHGGNPYYTQERWEV